MLFFFEATIHSIKYISVNLRIIHNNLLIVFSKLDLCFFSCRLDCNFKHFYCSFLFEVEMGEAVMDLLDAHEFNGDESLIVAARFLDFNGNHNDESTSVEMIVDGFERIRNKMKNRLLGLADTLDQTIAKHAEEKALYEQQNEANVEDLQRKLNLIQRTLNDVLKDNNAKSLANRRVNQFLWLIRERKLTLLLFSFHTIFYVISLEKLLYFFFFQKLDHFSMINKSKWLVKQLR